MKKFALIALVVLPTVLLAACSNGDTYPQPLVTFDPDSKTEIFGGGDERSFVYEIVRDISGSVSLVDHDIDMEEDGVLSQYALANGIGDYNIVTILRGGKVEMNAEFFIICDMDIIRMTYLSWGDMSAVEMVTELANHDKTPSGSIYEFYEDSTLTQTPIRTTGDEQAAILAISELSADRMERYMYFYIAQKIPETREVIGLKIMLWLNYLGELDYNALNELGGHMGIDFSSYVKGMW